MATALATARPEGRQGSPAPVIPFVRASTRQTLAANIDKSLTIAAGSQQVGVFELPASGYLRAISLLVTASGGTGAAAVYQADAPWSVIDQISVEDPTGRPIFGPISGYEAFLANMFGGYEDQVDPTTYAAYTAPSADGNFRFFLKIPIEASLRDGYASLLNQDSGAAYRVRISMGATTAVYSTNPTTLPSVRFQGWAELWTQPTATNLAGQAQQQTPPGLGTIQYWTKEVDTLVAGQNTVRIKRVGNLFRNLVLVTRNAAGARVSTLPDPIRIQWDNLTLYDEGLQLRLTKMRAAYGGIAAPTGVLVYTFCDDLDGKPGCELRNALLPTTPATRLTIEGSWGVAGSLTVLINDIQPVGLS